MKSNIHTLIPTSRTVGPEAASPDAFRQPNYDTTEQRDAMKLTIYVPGVEAAGVEARPEVGDIGVLGRGRKAVRDHHGAARRRGPSEGCREAHAVGCGEGPRLHGARVLVPFGRCVSPYDHADARRSRRTRHA